MACFLQLSSLRFGNELVFHYWIIQSNLIRIGIKDKVEIIVYGKPELMITKYCLLNKCLNTNEKCNVCQKNNYYHDEYVL